MIQGFAEAAQQTSPDEMMRLMHNLGDVILQRSGHRGFRLADRLDRQRAIGQYRPLLHHAQAARRAQAQRLADHRPVAAAACQGRGRQSLSAAGAGHQCRRPHRPRQLSIHLAGHQYRRAERMVAEAAGQAAYRCRNSPTSPAISLANAPRLQITINRDQASRFGISPQAIDDTLNDAFGQRQITQYFTQLKTYFLVLGNPARSAEGPLHARPALRQVAADRRRGAAFVAGQMSTAIGVGPLLISHQGQFPAVTITFNLMPGVALGQAVDAVNDASREIGMPAADHPDLPGQRAGVPDLAAQRAGADRRRADRRLHHSRRALRKLHPSADHSVDAAVGRRRRAACAQSRPHGPVGDRHHRHHSVDRHRQEERHHAGGFCHRGGTRPAYGAARGDPRGLPVALPPDPDDHGGSHAGRHSARARQRHRLGNAPAARLRHGRRPGASARC